MLGEGLRLVAIGAVIGLVGAFAAYALRREPAVRRSLRPIR